MRALRSRDFSLLSATLPPAIPDAHEASSEAILPSGLMPRISVVVPAKNEAENLPHVLPLIPQWVGEVILVDGNSTDATVEVARKLMPGIVVVAQEGRGKGAALRSGFKAARGEIIVTLDCDGSADPREIVGLVGALLSGADFVKGSRFIQGGETADMEWYRKAGNWGLLQLVKLRFGGRFTDLCYGYNAFWKNVLPLFNLDKVDGFEIETSMNVQALKANLHVFEVASKEYRRIHGSSNLRSIPDGWRVLKTIVKLGLSSQHAMTGPGTVTDLGKWKAEHRN